MCALFTSWVLGVTVMACAGTTEAPSPSVVCAVAPPFPVAAVAARTSGDVTVEVELDDEGTPITAIAVAGHQLFRAMSVLSDTALLWRFSPAASKSAVPRIVRVQFVFRLMAAEVPDKELAGRFIAPFTFEVRARERLPLVQN